MCKRGQLYVSESGKQAVRKLLQLGATGFRNGWMTLLSLLGTPPPCASTLKVIKTTVTRAPLLRQACACARRAVPKEHMSPETCPYLTLSTIVATGHYDTMCRQISASSGGLHCPSGPSGAVE